MTMTPILIVVFGALGFAAIGSFVCVVIDRLPLPLDEPNQYGEVWDTRPWGEVLGGTSRCSSCGIAVRPHQNIPVLSWGLLRGQCRSCGDRIPVYHPIVELSAPLLFLLSIWAIGLDWKILLALWLIPVGLAVAIIDLHTFMVPTRIVWPAFFVSVGLAILVAGVEGHWRWLLSALIGTAVVAGPLFVIWFAFPRGMGFGDVRLATLVGFNVGFFAGDQLIGAAMVGVICLALSSFVGIIVGFAAIGARGRKAKVPFGPPLLVSGYLCMLLAPQILSPFGF